jgi:mannose-6-phosphate isomerase
MALAPFTLDVALLPKAWGGRRLGAIYGDARDQLGEAWLCADLAETAQSGAGGQAMISAVVPGGSGASDLHAVLAQDPIGLLGFHAERFPLLVTFLDAAEHLSVQVHPSPTYARAHPGAHVKSEAWVVLEAERGAELMLGVEGLPDRAALAAAARDDALPDRLVRVPATPGTACWLPPGLVHALGAGTLVFEVQTASDTTYRLHDWTARYGRAPRAMHLEAGVDAALLDAAPVWGSSAGVADGGSILTTPNFEIGAVNGPSAGPVSAPLSASAGPRALLVVPVGGTALLAGAWGRMEAPAHRVTVVPAAVAADCRLDLPAGGRAFVVRVLGG